MEKGLADYLKQQLKIMVHKGRIDETDLNPLGGSQLSIDRIKSCSNYGSCRNYATDELEFIWPMFGEAFLVNYCCESCSFYNAKKENSQ